MLADDLTNDFGLTLSELDKMKKRMESMYAFLNEKRKSLWG
jgi:hypothetical protein